jgi:hypothetical protein
LFVETNTSVLLVISALSSGVFPARNRVQCQITNSRKIPPPARFILPGVVFHRDRKPRISCTDYEIKPGCQLYLFAGQNFISKSNSWAKTRVEHGGEAQTLLSKKDKICNLNELGRILNRTQVI